MNRYQSFVYLVVALAIAGCNGSETSADGGGGNPVPNSNQTPIPLSAPVLQLAGGTYVLYKGDSVNIAPANTGGDIAYCAVSPSLPTGLSLDSASCTLSGTASAYLAPTDFTITATNSAGSSSVVVNATIELLKGVYDASFGASGIASSNVGGYYVPPLSDTLLALADGTFGLMAGNATGSSLSRFNASGGQIAGYYGDLGWSCQALFGIPNCGVGAAIALHDGSIFTAYLYGPPGILRFRKTNSAGLLDTGFSPDGMITRRATDISSSLNDFTYPAMQMAEQADNKILVYALTGYEDDGSGTSTDVSADPVLMRLNADASLDTSFHSIGGIFPSGVYTAGFALDRATGNTYLASLATDGTLAVSKYDSTGAAMAFGSGSVILPNSAAQNSVTLTFDSIQNKLVVVASDQTTASIYRINPDGTLDADFGTNGVAQIAVAGSGQSFLPIHVVIDSQSDKVIVLGNVRGFNGGGLPYGHFTLLELNADGSPDAAFGNNGRLDGSNGNSSADTIAMSIIITADHRLMVGSNNQNVLDFGGGAYLEYGGVMQISEIK